MASLEPARITKLSQDVINRIAAGEVIQRPSNALKELLENSLDAKASQIRLYLRDGGLTELRIEDNGTGILAADFPLLCERFATSKLKSFEDLSSCGTYGFRGEALASISFCAQLTVTSRPKGEQCAFRAHFINGKMYDPEDPDCSTQTITPSVVAGVPGTQLIIKKLFYNMTLRQKALFQRSSQEYGACLRVASCYAIHNYHCSFTVTKVTDNNGRNNKNRGSGMDLNYRASPKKTAKDVIKTVYGGDIGSYLIDIQREHDRIEGLKIEGVISNCDFAMNVAASSSNKNRKSSKKRIFNTNQRTELVLFINHRLVESNQIKKCIQSVYDDYLAKNHRPFVYLSITVPPHLVDVNVHPTKKEVKFLHRDEVMQLIQETIDEALKKGNNSRTFTAHSLQHFMTRSDTHNGMKRKALDISPNNNNNYRRTERRAKRDKLEGKEMKKHSVSARTSRHRDYESGDKMNGLHGECKKDKVSEIVHDDNDGDDTDSVQIKRETQESLKINDHHGVIKKEENKETITQSLISLVDSHRKKERKCNVVDEDYGNDLSPSLLPNAPLKRRNKRHSLSSYGSNGDSSNSLNPITSNSMIDLNLNHRHHSKEEMDVDDAVNGLNESVNDVVITDRIQSPQPVKVRPIRRKRTHSEMLISSDEEEETDPVRGSSNMECDEKPHLVTVILDEKKKTKKGRKDTRRRVDAQQSNLDYYWNAPDDLKMSQSTKRRKLSDSHKVTSSTTSTNQKHKSRDKKEEHKDQESEDEDSDIDPALKRHRNIFLTKKQIETKVIPQPECVEELIQMIEHNGDANLEKVFAENIFVGAIDAVDRTMNHHKNEDFDSFVTNSYQRVLFQYDTKLYLCNIHRISRVYFFELCIRNIGKFRTIYKLIPNPTVKEENGLNASSFPTIYELILLALEVEESKFDEEEMGSKEDVARSVTDTLCQSTIAKILRDYFAVGIDTKRKVIESLPSLIDGYVPGLMALPVFLLRLVTEIEWFKENEDGTMSEEVDIEDRNLFKQIAMEIARFYQIRPPSFYFKVNENPKKERGHRRFGQKAGDKVNDKKHNMGWILQHVIFRSMNKKRTKYSFHPPRFLCNDGSIVQIACTKQLYKVFERC